MRWTITLSLNRKSDVVAAPNFCLLIQVKESEVNGRRERSVVHIKKCR